MADKIAQGVVELTMDPAGLEAGSAKAVKSIDSITQAASRAGEKSSKGIDKIGDSAIDSASKVDKATKNIQNSIERTIATVQAGGRGTSGFFESLANARGIDPAAIQPYITKLKEAEKAAADAAKSNTSLGLSAKETAFALRGVPAQISDIAISLQGGQRPLSVFLQQGAQLKDMFGGTGNAARALSGYLVGLINPYTIITGAVVGLAAAYYSGSEQSDRLNKSLIASGNILGATTSSLETLIQKTGKLSGNYGDVRDATEMLARGGVITGNILESAVTGISAGTAVTGKSIKELTADFESLAKDPVASIKKLNETQNFLTADIYKQIKALKEQGKEQEATALAVETYSKALADRKSEITDNLGYIEKAWKGIKDATLGAIDSAAGFGRQLTDAEKLLKLQQELALLNQKTGYVADGRAVRNGSDKEIAAKQAEIDDLKRQQNTAKYLATDAARSQASEKAKIAQSDLFDKYVGTDSRFNKADLLTKRIQEEEKAFRDATAGLDQNTKEYALAVKRRDTAIAELKDKASAGDNKKAESERQKELNSYNTLIASIKSQTVEVNSQIGTNEKLTASQKIRIKLNEDLAAGTVTLTEVHKKQVQADIDALSISEKRLQADKLQKEINQYNSQAAVSLKEKTDALEVEYQLYGKTDTARQTALISIKAHADVQAKLTSLEKEGYTVSEDVIKQLYAKADANTAVEQSILGQSKALTYAEQLHQENKKYSLSNIFDDKARAAAEIKVDDEMWQERIKMAGDGTIAQKKLQDEYVDYSKNRLNAPLVDEWKRTVSTYDTVFRNGFANMLNGGTGTFTAWTRSLRTTFKTSVADYLYNLLARPFVIKVVGSFLGIESASGVAGSLLGSSGTATGSASSTSSLTGLLSKGGTSLFDLIGQGNSMLTSGIEKLGVLISNGNGGIADAIGGFIGKNAGSIGTGLGYAGAALQLFQGNIAGAALTAVGTAIGGPIGGAIGGLIGSFFGGSKTKGDQVNGTYTNGTYRNTASFSPEGGGSVGAASTLQNINQQFTQTLGSFLTTLGQNPNINVVSNYKAKKDVQAAFSGSVNGVGFGTGWENFGSGSDAFQKFFDKTFSTVLVQGIKASGISGALKSLFDGLTDKTAIANMMQSTLSLNSAQTQLANSFNLTVDAAARVAKTQSDVTGAINNLISAAGAMQTIGDQVLASKAALQQATGFQVLPASLKDFDNLLKQVDTSTAEGVNKFASLFSSRAAFSALTTTTDSLKTNVTGAIYNVAGDERKTQIANKALSDLFGSLNLQVPASVDQLIKLGDSIDYTTKSGLDLANAFPSLVDAFTKAKGGVDSLAASLNGIDENSFANVVDFNRYKATSSTYGAAFAADYTSNLSAGRISFNTQGEATTGGGADLITEVQALRDDLKAALIAVALSTQQTANTLKRWNGDGMPEVRNIAA